MLKCRDVAKESDQLLARESPWQRRLAMAFHLLICGHCRRYIHHMKVLIRAIPFMHGKANEEEVARVMKCIHSGTEPRSHS